MKRKRKQRIYKTSSGTKRQTLKTARSQEKKQGKQTSYKTKQIPTKKRAKKKKNLLKKFIFGFKIVILGITSLILLALFAIAVVWGSKYVKMLYIYTTESIRAWRNFFSYLQIPADVKNQYMAYIKYGLWMIGIIIVAMVLFKLLLIVMKKTRKHTLSKRNTVHTTPTKQVQEPTQLPISNHRGNEEKIIVLSSEDIPEITSSEKKHKTKESNESNNIEQGDQVILLGPEGKNVIKRSWEETEVIPSSKQQKTEKITKPQEEKVIPLKPQQPNEKKKAQPSERKTVSAKKPLPNTIQSASTPTYSHSEINDVPIHLISHTPPDYLDKVRPEAERNAGIILDLLSEFGIDGELSQLQIGPRVSRYEIKIPKGTRVDKIKRLSTDIATALGVRNIRLELSVPRKPQTIAIEVPNSISGTVHISSIIRTKAFTDLNSPTPLVLGLDVTGKPVVEDLRKQPHLLIAGATGSGKSVCINTILVGMLMKASPDQLRLMLVDPKRVELSPYAHLPHLIFPILTEASEAVAGLEWMIREMDRRYRLLKEHGVRSIESFNSKVEPSQRLPYIVIIIDELADLMMVSAGETEQKIARLAQLARAAGIHLILATQRPSTDVITGLIKANVPARIAFAVSSQVDSRVILDTTGAEKLLGMGDMLFMSPRYRHPIRIQGAYTADEDINAIVDYWSRRYPQEFEELNLIELSGDSDKSSGSSPTSYDPLLREAWKLIVQHNRPSVSFLQRKLRVGFNRASRIMDQLEDLGVVSPPEGPQGKRQILRTDYESDL